MDVKAQLVDKISKDGNKYQAIVIKITPTYEKMVFLEKAEVELLKVSNMLNK